MKKPIAMPVLLRVMGKRVKVTEAVIEGDDDYGQCSHPKGLLTISPAQTDDCKRDPVLHELTHWLDEEMQTKMTERQVRLISTALLAAIRDNPALVAYLTAD